MNPTTACFERSYTGSGGNGMIPASELVATIAPPPESRIERIAARVPKTTPSTLTRMIRS